MERQNTVPAFGLYGEGQLFPELIHVERIFDRAHGHSWTIAPHRHPHLHQFLLIQSGEATARVDANFVPIPAGHAISLPPWTVHGFHFEPFTEGLVVSLPVAEFPALFDGGEIAQRLKHWQKIKTPDALMTAAASLYDAFGNATFGRRNYLKNLGEILGLRFAEAQGDTGDLSMGTPTDTLVLRFESLVRQRFRERLKLEDYARALAVSASHLSRCCKEMTGAPASRFIESVVFREACTHLAYSRLPVAQIGYDLGFQDAAYFSRAFRKHTGMSPGAYRKSVARVGQTRRSAAQHNETSFSGQT